MEETIPVSIRGVDFKLMGYTRSLELCARMNYETENLDFIDLIEPGNCFYDLGACEGRFSIYAALKGLRVFSFEPENRNFKVLGENIEQNLLSTSITRFNLALGKTNDVGIMKIGQPWEGGHQKVVNHDNIRQDLNFNFVEEQVVNIVSLDDHIREQNLPMPNYLKVDIDGSEVPFLNGSNATLQSVDLRGIIFELDKADNNFSQIIKRLAGIGFEVTSEHQVPNEKHLFNIIFNRN